MSILSLLYQLFLSPLTLLFEGVYYAAFSILRSSGACIFPLSLVVNLLLLPFYNRADAIQAEERAREKKLSFGIDHIKKTFKGDERYMMLQTYYRQNHYKPIYALRSSLALFLEIPFFIAAYHFLSHLQDFQGSSFGILKNLAAPDALIHLGGISINVLPILMTAINVVSSEIYTKDLKLKDKIQLHGMALIFLVLLYNSPSGLVLYWTLNNIFSLLKNVVNGSKNKARTAGILFSIAGVGVILFALLGYKYSSVNKILIADFGLIMQLPLIVSFLSKKQDDKKKKEKPITRSDSLLFFSGALLLSLFIGFLIPSDVIASAPTDFILIKAVHSPIRYIIYSFLTGLGAFVLWCGLFYYLSGNKAKRVFSIVIWLLSFVAITNYMLFGDNYSLLTMDLRLDQGYWVPEETIYLNMLAVILVALATVLIFLRKEAIIKFVSPVLILGVAVLCSVNIYKIQKVLPPILARVKAYYSDDTKKESFNLSQTGENVVVIMLDRSISSYIPYLFQENPELERQFDGFTWYPNTLSFGTRTLTGSPALYGGYEYTPDKLNQRADTPLVEKHDEAILTMPVLFWEAGYEVTVCDPAYAGYSSIPDLSIFDDYPEINTFNTEYGMFRESNIVDVRIQEVWTRNFFCYGLMKSMPLIVQPKIYQDGIYFEPGNSGTVLKQANYSDRITISPGLIKPFTDAYEALCAYPEMTNITSEDKNTFLMITNSTTHNVMLLQEPEYIPQATIDNAAYDLEHQDRFTLNGQTLAMDNAYQMAHYQSNMAALMQLGNWLDYLRENGVYDNTRIIIVADHGWSLEQRDDMLFGPKGGYETIYNPEDAMAYNPLLLYKDFGSTGTLQVDDTFMTNADTPYLAMNGLIDNPLHPLTHLPVFTPDAKNAEKLYTMYTDNWSVEYNGGNTFDDVLWFSLSNQNVLDKNNWHEEEEPQ